MSLPVPIRIELKLDLRPQGGHVVSEFLKMFGTDIQDGPGGHLKTLQTTSSFKPYVCRIKPTVDRRHWGQHGDSELLKLFHSYFQDGQHGSHLEILQKHVLLQNHIGGIGNMEIQNC